jgi:hypothetical protein
VAPAFISPSAEEVASTNLPPEVQSFLSRHDRVIAAQGWFGYFVQGVHVYSFDMLAECLPRLKAAFAGVGLVTVISGNYAPEHRAKVLAMRRERKLEGDWLIVEQPFSAAALYARSDVFVRPTITDGDSVSIRECLALGTPVVASDSVKRPEGCVLFRNRDLEDFTRAVLEVLRNKERYRAQCASAKIMDAAEHVRSVYQRLLESRGRVVAPPTVPCDTRMS